MSSKYINSKFVYQQEGIDYADDHCIGELLQTHLQNALLEIDALKEANEAWRKQWASERYEVEQLKAQVNRFREILSNIDKDNYDEPTFVIQDALSLTAEQCLAEVKAKAIEDAVECTENMISPPCANHGIAEPEMMCASSDLLELANSLRVSAL